MAGTIDKTFRQPVLVDERFLVNADRTVREALSSLQIDIAAAFSVDATKLANYVAGQRIPANLSDRYRYEMALSAFLVKHTVRWKNDLSEEFSDISSVIKALESEHAKPYSIVMRGGEYGYPNVTLTIRDRLEETVVLRATGNRDNLRVIAEKTKFLLGNSSPDFALLHHPHTKTFFLIAMFGLWFIGLLLLPDLLKAEGPLSASQFFGAAGWVTATALLACNLYLWTFPSVVFDYGRGKATSTRKRLAFAAFGVLVASLVAFVLPTVK